MRFDSVARVARVARVAHVASVAGCVLAGLMLGERDAAAYHDETQRLTEDTAYTLPAHTVRLGLWQVAYAPVDSFSFGTYLWPWVLRIANVHVKERFYQNDPLAFAVSASGYVFNTRSLRIVTDQAGDANVAVLPLELAASYRLTAFTLSLGLAWTQVWADGSFGQDALGGAGRGAASNLQVTSTVEWRATQVTALVLHARYLIFQRLTGAATAELHPDPYTTVDVHATALPNALDYRGAASVTAAVALSFETFNLRAGVGYGNYNVPGVNFVIDRRLVYPDLDFYWIF